MTEGSDARRTGLGTTGHHFIRIVHRHNVPSGAPEPEVRHTDRAERQPLGETLITITHQQVKCSRLFLSPAGTKTNQLEFRLFSVFLSLSLATFTLSVIGIDSHIYCGSQNALFTQQLTVASRILFI